MLRALGTNISEGYVNLHLLPIFKHKIAYGNSGFPWKFNKSKKYNYKIGDCPVAERLHNETFIHLSMYTLDYKLNDIKKIISNFKKVWKKLSM